MEKYERITRETGRSMLLERSFQINGMVLARSAIHNFYNRQSPTTNPNPRFQYVAYVEKHLVSSGRYCPGDAMTTYDCSSAPANRI